MRGTTLRLVAPVAVAGCVAIIAGAAASLAAVGSAAERIGGEPTAREFTVHDAPTRDATVRLFFAAGRVDTAGRAALATVGPGLAAAVTDGVVDAGAAFDAIPSRGGAGYRDVIDFQVLDVQGLRVALVAVVREAGWLVVDRGAPGVLTFLERGIRDEVARARARADVVVVALDGDAVTSVSAAAATTPSVEALAGWGADAVWDRVADVDPDVRTIDPDGDGRPSVVVTGGGPGGPGVAPVGLPPVDLPPVDLLPVDQKLADLPPLDPGGVVEVLAGADGVRAVRIGETGIAAGGADVDWRPPDGDAVALAGSWWTLARPVEPVSVRRPDPRLVGTLGVEMVDAVVGDPDADGDDEVVAVFRRQFRPTEVSLLLPELVQVDAQGRDLHLGIYSATDLGQEWVAGTLFRPVSAVAACDGALALAFSSGLDAADRVALGASLWGGFGFVNPPQLSDLPGSGVPACADVDGDGATDPLVIERTAVEGAVR